MHALTPAVLATVLAALPVHAKAEPLGRITAYIDGTEMTWHTITMPRGDQTVATAHFDQGARLTELYVQGHPEALFSTRDMFSVEVRYLGPFTWGAQPLSVDVMYMPEGMAGPFWTSRDANVPASIDVVELDLWGNVGRVTATFAAELCRREIISSATDPTNCRDVNGMIQTELLAN